MPESTMMTAIYSPENAKRLTEPQLSELFEIARETKDTVLYGQLCLIVHTKLSSFEYKKIQKHGLLDEVSDYRQNMYIAIHTAMHDWSLRKGKLTTYLNAPLEGCCYRPHDTVDNAMTSYYRDVNRDITAAKEALKKEDGISRPSEEQISMKVKEMTGREYSKKRIRNAVQMTAGLSRNQVSVYTEKGLIPQASNSSSYEDDEKRLELKETMDRLVRVSLDAMNQRERGIAEEWLDAQNNGDKYTYKEAYKTRSDWCEEKDFKYLFRLAILNFKSQFKINWEAENRKMKKYA